MGKKADILNKAPAKKQALKSTSKKAKKPNNGPLLTKTALAYLANSIDRLSDPIHPNFKKALEKNKASLDTQLMIRVAAAKGFDKFHDDPMKAVVRSSQYLTQNVRAYVQYWKDLMSNCAFSAYMDINQLRGQSSPEQLEEGMGQMADDLPWIDDLDTPLFDESNNSNRDINDERYAGGDAPQPIAAHVNDAYEAIRELQLWIGLAFSGMNEESRLFWGVENAEAPLGQRWDDDGHGGRVYTPLLDLDDYMAWQKESYRRKMQVVDNDNQVAELMLSA